MTPDEPLGLFLGTFVTPQCRPFPQCTPLCPSSHTLGYIRETKGLLGIERCEQHGLRGPSPHPDCLSRSLGVQCFQGVTPRAAWLKHCIRWPACEAVCPIGAGKEDRSVALADLPLEWCSMQASQKRCLRVGTTAVLVYNQLCASCLSFCLFL